MGRPAFVAKSRRPRSKKANEPTRAVTNGRLSKASSQSEKTKPAKKAKKKEYAEYRAFFLQ